MQTVDVQPQQAQSSTQMHGSASRADAAHRTRVRARSLDLRYLPKQGCEPQATTLLGIPGEIPPLAGISDLGTGMSGSRQAETSSPYSLVIRWTSCPAARSRAITSTALDVARDVVLEALLPATTEMKLPIFMCSSDQVATGQFGQPSVAVEKLLQQSGSRGGSIVAYPACRTSSSYAGPSCPRGCD